MGYSLKKRRCQHLSPHLFELPQKASSTPSNPARLCLQEYEYA